MKGLHVLYSIDSEFTKCPHNLGTSLWHPWKGTGLDTYQLPVTQHSKPWLISSQGYRRHWRQCLLKDRRHGIHGQGSHHTEVLLPKTKSQHVQPGPCGVHLPAQEPLRYICSHLSPRGVTFRAVAPRQQESWWGRAPRRSADTAAQYSVPLCQEQLPDMNLIWHRVLTVVTPCVSTSDQAIRVNLKFTQRKNSQVPPAKSYLILIKYFKPLPYLFNPRQYS